MNRLLLLAVLLPVLTFSQTEFKFENGLLNTSSVVRQVDSVDSEALFNKTINWIKETYKNPDEVIKATINNQKIRFIGSSDSGFKIYFMGSEMYTP